MTQAGDTGAGSPARASAASRKGLDFIIVGTPRSGSTLVQRLACELPGVRVPPETHFLSELLPGLLRRRSFPLDAAAVRSELERYSQLPNSRGLPLDIDAIVEDLGEGCGSALQLFEALVRQLAGPSERLGEKTTDHTMWWRPLTHALPQLKVIALMRDPRATIASTLPTPWASHPSVAVWGEDRHIPLAERWRFNELQVGEMRRTLGERCLVLRYEDLVADAEGSRAAIGRLLGVGGTAGPAGAPDGTAPPLFLEWETWKHRSLEPATTERVDAWRREGALTPQQAAEVTALCRRGMARFGYGREDPAAATWAAPLWLGPRGLVRCARTRRSTRRRLAAVEAVDLTGALTRRPSPS